MIFGFSLQSERRKVDCQTKCSFAKVNVDSETAFTLVNKQEIRKDLHSSDKVSLPAFYE